MIILIITRRCFFPTWVPQCHASSNSSCPVGMGIKATANASNGCLKPASASFAPSLTFSWLLNLLCLAVLHPGLQAQIWKSPVQDRKLLLFWQYLLAALVELNQGPCDACVRVLIDAVNRMRLTYFSHKSCPKEFLQAGES